MEVFSLATYSNEDRSEIAILCSDISDNEVSRFSSKNTPARLWWAMITQRNLPLEPQEKETHLGNENPKFRLPFGGHII